MPADVTRDRGGASLSRRLVLASGSPRRRALLETLGLAFEVRPADIDETPGQDETAARLVERLARQKSEAVAAAGEIVLAADTAVSIDSEILGKPPNDEAARSMLDLLSGRDHTVSTGVAVHVPERKGSGRTRSTVVSTTVTFAALSDDDKDWYVGTGEGRDKAGGYGIQVAGGLFVTRIEGSQSNVVGLPLAETRDLMRRSGMDLLSFGRR